MRSVAVSAVLFIFTCAAFSATIHVPGDYPQIQQAIVAAKGGDTILVDPGTYFETIDFLGKPVLVKSCKGAKVTIIDGSHGKSVVRFQSGEKPDSVLEGFTIRNGNNAFSSGGGISCWKFSSPTIRGNIILENSASFGGGISCLDHSSPAIQDNVVMGNKATADGGGISCGPDCAPKMGGNRIIGNKAGDEGGGIHCEHAFGVIVNNVIIDNAASYAGGGISLNAGSDLMMINNTLSGNSAFAGGGVFSSSGSTSALVNTILWADAGNQGQEIHIAGSKPPSTMVVSYSDVEGGKAKVFVAPPSQVVWGPVVIQEKPVFVDPLQHDFHLSWLSPCVNRGTNEDAPPEDPDGDPRPYMGTVDMGADEFAGLHALEADKFKIPPYSGGVIQFTLCGGPGSENREYILFASLSGTVPGTPLPGNLATLPLKWDAFSDLVIAFLNTPIFQNFTGTLDSQGKASAVLDTLGPVPVTSGLNLYFAFGLGKPWDFASNPIVVGIL